MTKKDFIKKFTSYDQDMENAFLRGYRTAYDKMTEVQQAELRTAESGMVVTSQASIDKLVADAKKDGAYEVKMKFNKCVQQYKKSIEHNVEECWLPEDIVRGQGYKDAYDIFKQIFQEEMR